MQSYLGLSSLHPLTFLCVKIWPRMSMIIIINSHIFGEDTNLAYSIKLSEILNIKNMNS